MPKRKHAVVEAVSAASVEDTADSPATEATTPRRKSSRKKAPAQNWDPYASIDASSPLTSPEPEASPTKGKSPRKGRKNKEPVVYDIPPITEHKTTTFKGRLGYACLNTILRAERPPIFCSRTCRIATLKQNGLQYAKDLGIQNTLDLKKMVEWNEANGIKFMRVSSEMFPFASHKEWGYDLEYAKDALKEAGDFANKLGHRLTTHPGQFTQIASPKENVVEASIRELDYHCQMMRYMGLGKDSVIILHMGGVYGDKPTTIARFKENYTKLLTDEMKARLVLENDEMCYSPDDLLPVCEELDIPIVLDYHHNYINPSVLPLSELIPRINKTWAKKGIRPKQHLSEPRPGLWYNDWKKPVSVLAGSVSADGVPEDGEHTGEEKAEEEQEEQEAAPEPEPAKKVSVMELRAHANRCTSLPDEVVLMGEDGKEGGGDLMIEAKDKEQAVFQLHRIYNLKPVKHENLRPEKAPLTKSRASKGRGDGDGDDVDPDAASPKKRKVRKAASPTDDANSLASPTKTPSPRKRGKKADQPAETGTTTPRKRRRTKAELGEEELASLVNQEDVPMPVDGAPLPVVEAEEHPEAAEAAEEGEGGCGVEGDKKGVRKARRGRAKA